MNDYSMKVKKLIDVFASIQTPINDSYDLGEMILNGFEKYYNQF
jgi:hypothetical protein